MVFKMSKMSFWKNCTQFFFLTNWSRFCVHRLMRSFSHYRVYTYTHNHTHSQTKILLPLSPSKRISLSNTKMYYSPINESIFVWSLHIWWTSNCSECQLNIKTGNSYQQFWMLISSDSIIYASAIHPDLKRALSNYIIIFWFRLRYKTTILFLQYE